LVYEDVARGKGLAVRIGLQHASGEVILFQDADLEYDVEDYDALVAPLFEMKRNFVLGSRHDARGTGWKIRHFQDQPWISTASNLAHRFLLSMFNSIYGQSLRDPFTMYKVFRRDCLYGLSFECNRFDFDYEITIKLIRKGYRPIELPVNYESRSFSEGKKVSFFRDPPTWVHAMFKMQRTCLYEELAE
jgi:glycosyltransferase involved in cell wall biosynthesis